MHIFNKNGEYIRVIFGTDKTREGITLKNIQKIHILTPGWNFGKKNQAEGRGIRFGSHNDLDKGKNIKVEIYTFGFLFDNSDFQYSINKQTARVSIVLIDAIHQFF